MNKDSTILWYNKPASAWTQALPVGNGTLGAMVFGKTDKEVLSLNHDELWSGFPQDKSNKDSYKSFVEARDLALAGKLNEAQTLIETKCLGEWTQAYMPLCDLLLHFGPKRKTTDYKRWLDLTDAVTKVEYTINETKFKRELFASFPDKAIAMKLTAEGAENLKFTLSVKSELKTTVSAENDLLLIDGECPSKFERHGSDFDIGYYEGDEKRGIQFRAAVRVESDGVVKYLADTIKVSGATQAVIYFTCQTSFNGWDKQPFLQGKEYKEACIKQISQLNDYENVKSAHIADYKQYYKRVKLDIGSNKKSEKEDVPTDQRLKDFKKDKNDSGLYTLLFNFGRYLAIASSREGSQPSNLQGIWNHLLCPPWNSNYTVNINTEMNYWPILMCGMPELNLPLVEMIKDISISGQKTAKDYYNAPGFVCHHNIDLWRHTLPVKGDAVYAFWPMASGWLSRHLYEHYEYTLDKDFLSTTAYPILKAAAEFYLAILVEDKDGYLIAAPSTSPENTFFYKAKICSLSQTTTMTMSIIKDLFQNCIKATEVLDDDKEFSLKLKETLKKLLPFKIGSKGQLLEWYEEAPEVEPRHRHVSHLYALHPANLISVEKTPELAQACKKTLELRGDNGTGWSLGWKINFWARLRDGNHALELLNKQLNFVKSSGFNYSSGGGTYANLFDAHPPFQIDGNFGAVSGIIEMLMQSVENDIYLLPALPDKWANGSIEGLAAKGNVKVNITWRNGALTKYELIGAGNVNVIYNGVKTRHQLDGEKLVIELN
ncbi:MAG TPA: glycoside hydrolase family 95 protein [Clostridia bacterium]|nr:glycoside hydrolase family 95 protein [Clostridia bacterium]